MLFKFIVISIFLPVSFINSVKDNKPVIPCDSDDNFLFRAKESAKETVGVVFTNQSNPMPAWMQNDFRDTVSMFLEIPFIPGKKVHTEVVRYFENKYFPTLYIVKKNRLLDDKLTGVQPPLESRRRSLALWATKEDAQTKYKGLVTEDLEKLLDDKKAGITVGSTSKSSRWTRKGRKKRSFENIDLNEPLSTANDYNSNMSTTTSGSRVTYAFNCEWGDTFHYGNPNERTSTSPPATGSVSKRPSISTHAPTESGGTKRPSRSPSTGSGGFRRPQRSPSL